MLVSWPHGHLCSLIRHIPESVTCLCSYGPVLILVMASRMLQASDRLLQHLQQEHIAGLTARSHLLRRALRSWRARVGEERRQQTQEQRRQQQWSKISGWLEEFRGAKAPGGGQAGSSAAWQGVGQRSGNAAGNRFLELNDDNDAGDDGTAANDAPTIRGVGGDSW
jgi:hypothetical protein